MLVTVYIPQHVIFIAAGVGFELTTYATRLTKALIVWSGLDHLVRHLWVYLAHVIQYTHHNLEFRFHIFSWLHYLKILYQNWNLIFAIPPSPSPHSIVISCCVSRQDCCNYGKCDSHWKCPSCVKNGPWDVVVPCALELQSLDHLIHQAVSQITWLQHSIRHF